MGQGSGRLPGLGWRGQRWTLAWLGRWAKGAGQLPGQCHRRSGGGGGAALAMAMPRSKRQPRRHGRPGAARLWWHTAEPQGPWRVAACGSFDDDRAPSFTGSAPWTSSQDVRSQSTGKGLSAHGAAELAASHDAWVDNRLAQNCLRPVTHGAPLKWQLSLNADRAKSGWICSVYS